MFCRSIFKPPALAGMLASASALGWLLLPAGSHVMPAASVCSAFDAGVASDWKRLAFELRDPAAWDVFAWFTMLLAMAPPLIFGALMRFSSRYSSWALWRGAGSFLLGYGVVWLAAIPGLVVLIAMLHLLGERWAVPPLLLGCAVAAAWQMTPLKRRALEVCYRPASPPRHSNRDVRHGLIHGIGCAGSCWALMLVPMTSPVNGRSLMLLVTLVALSERWRSGRRFQRLRSGERLSDVANLSLISTKTGES